MDLMNKMQRMPLEILRAMEKANFPTGPRLDALLSAHPDYADTLEEYYNSDTAAAAKARRARVRIVG